MAQNLAYLRRNLAQRLDYWGGSLTDNTPATTTALSASNTLIDTNRSESDDAWVSAWIVLNPGSTDQTGSPTIWREIADTGGWVLSSGTFTINGSWPSPYQNGVPSGTDYEIFTVFKPSQWLQAINYALAASYPYRHRAVVFEIPERNYTRLIDYGRLAQSQITVSTPTLAPTVTEVADGTGAFQAGTYTVGYTYYNDFGETTISPKSTVTIAGSNSQIKIAELSVPAGVVGVNYYCSLQPDDTSIDLLDTGSAVFPTGAVPDDVTLPGEARRAVPGMNYNGSVYALVFPTPNPWFGVSPPSQNTTQCDFFRLHTILQRVNPGGQPEIWNELPGSLWQSEGDTRVRLAFMPIPGYSLRFILTATLPILSGETDQTSEPTELIYNAAEYYLWDLLVKNSSIVNVSWTKLAQDAYAKFQTFLAAYRMDIPRDTKHTPLIKTFY